MAIQPKIVPLFDGPSEGAYMRSYLNILIIELNAAIQALLSGGVNSGLLYPTFVASNYSVISTDQMVVVNAAGGNYTMTFNPTGLNLPYKMIGFVKSDSSANTVTISDGTSTQWQLTSKGQSIFGWSDGIELWMF